MVGLRELLEETGRPVGTGSDLTLKRAKDQLVSAHTQRSGLAVHGGKERLWDMYARSHDYSRDYIRANGRIRPIQLETSTDINGFCRTGPSASMRRAPGADPLLREGFTEPAARAGSAIERFAA